MQITVICIISFFKKWYVARFLLEHKSYPKFLWWWLSLKFWDFVSKWQHCSMTRAVRMAASSLMTPFLQHSSSADLGKKGQKCLFYFLCGSTLTVHLIVLEVNIEERIWKTYNRRFVSAGIGATGMPVQVSCPSNDKYHDFQKHWKEWRAHVSSADVLQLVWC